MNFTRLPVTLALCALGCLALRTGLDSTARAEEGEVEVGAVLRRNTVRLGDDVVVDVTVTNRTPNVERVPELRLSRQSVTLKLAFAEGGGTLVTRRYGQFTEADGEIRFEPAPTRLRRLDPGESLTAQIRFAAVGVGNFLVTPLVGPPGGDRLKGPQMALKITPRGVQKTLSLEFETTKGRFRVALDGTRCFNSVSHVWTLARERFYDGMDVHRVVTGVLVQSGDPRGDGTGTAGWYLPSEYQTPGFGRGWFGLARGPHADSAGSQWFVSLTEGPRGEKAFSAGYTALGRVTDGMEVVEALGHTKLPEGSDRPKSPERILKVTTHPK